MRKKKGTARPQKLGELRLRDFTWNVMRVSDPRSRVTRGWLELDLRNAPHNVLHTY